MAAMDAPRSVSALSDTLDQVTQSVVGPIPREDPRYIICIDFGTTFTGVGWILTQGRTPSLSDINIVKNWGTGEIQPKVPSVLTYSSNAGQKWGFGVGNSAYVIRWTKLKLEVPIRLDALRSMRRLLDEAKMLDFGTRAQNADIPRHLIRTPVDIVTDYLKEVIRQARVDIENNQDGNTLQQFPIDLVITHPAVWDERAKNLTFRAVTSAFHSVFHDLRVRSGQIRLATEPEACAHYTLQAAQAERGDTVRQLRVGECFIVVDAGGGTVDLVSYRIDQVTPEFRITKITPVSGGQFGATRIDNYFLYKFLRPRLGPANYSRLLAMGGSRERHGRANHTVLKVGEQLVLDKFEQLKRGFEGRASGVSILDLPFDIVQSGPAGGPQRETEGVAGGSLHITCREMETMFQECVEGIQTLIQQQLLLVDRQRLTVRTIFLSGGFSNNKYLFDRIQDLASSWRFELLRGADPWTGVAKGGVLLGLGLGARRPRAVVPCPYSFGVVTSRKFALYLHRNEQRYEDSLDGVHRARDHVEWVISKGDLIRPDEPAEKTVELVKKITQTGSRAGRVTIIVTASDDPHRLSPIDSPRQEVTLDFDLANIPDEVYRHVARRAMSLQGKSYESVQMQLEISVHQDRAEFELVCGKTVDMNGRTTSPGFPLSLGEPIVFAAVGQK